MTPPVAYPLKFQAGARIFLSVSRPLVRVAYELDDVLAARPLALPPLDRAQGYIITSLPEALLPDGRNGMIQWVRQSYTRHHADFGAGFDAYMAHFSGKSRATIRRKLRRYAEEAGGAIDVTCYRSPDEIAEFLEAALPVSRSSYQHRLLKAGLPDSDAHRREMLTLAAADRVRAFLLRRNGRPVAYLYLPVAGDVLIYAYLGYDPDEADLSPGTVLQVEAIRLLAAEGRYSRLDFTEGDGQHKRLFGTDGVACVDVLLLRASVANHLLIGALRGFDALVARAKSMSEARGLGWLKALRR